MTSTTAFAAFAAAQLSRDARNHSRRLFDAPRVIYLLCGREYDRLHQYRNYCSSSCARLDKQRQGRVA